MEQNHTNYYGTYFLIVMLCMLIMPTLKSEARQLKELEIESFVPENTPIPVFTNYPEKAAIIVRSSLTNLQFESNLKVFAQLGVPAEGEYVLIVDPARQSINISVPGYRRGRIPVQGLQPRSVQYYRVEPKNEANTEKGTLVVQTVPEGATLQLDGIPGTEVSNHTYSDILAQSYILKITMDDYQTEERLVTVDPARPIIERVELIPNFGFLQITTQGATLYLKDEEAESEYRRSYTSGTPLRLQVGTYEYRLEREFFLEQRGTFTVEPGGVARVDTELQPAYGTLRVDANVSNVQLTSQDNEAPSGAGRNQIYLENGLRTVVVSAPGYVSEEITVRIQPGETLTEAVELETTAARNERRRRESLPKGILQVAADVDAEIYVNGELQGTGEVVLTLIPDRYEVEFRHPVGRKKIQVQVAPSELSDQAVQLRPVRSRALTLSALIPGSGHLYRKNGRGWFYMGLTAGAAAATYLTINGKSRAQQDYDAAQLAYSLSTSASDASQRRLDVLQRYQEVQDATSMVTITAGVTAGLYALQLLDVMVTRPKYGYRTTESIDGETFGVRISPVGFTFSARF